MSRVQEPQFRELVGPDVVGDDDVHLLQREAGTGEVVLDHPLPERFGDDGPAVADAHRLREPGDVGRCGDGCDAIDHAVGKAHVLRNPLGQIAVDVRGGTECRGACDVPVLHDVVARQHRECGAVASSTGVEPTRHDVEDPTGCRRSSDELAGLVVHRIAALRDGHRHDLGVGVGDGLDQIGRVLGRHHEVDDRPDDRHVGVIRAARDQGVEVVLAGQRVGHPGIPREEARTDDRPLRVAGRADLVDVGGEVGTVKSADADVHDAASKRSAVVSRYRHLGIEGGQGGVVETAG